MMTGDHNVDGAEVFGDGLRGFINGAISGVYVCQINHAVVSVRHHGNDGVYILITGIGLLVDVIQTERHIPDIKCNIVSVSVARIAVNDFRL